MKNEYIQIVMQRSNASSLNIVLAISIEENKFDTNKMWKFLEPIHSIFFFPIWKSERYFTRKKKQRKFTWRHSLTI